MSAAAGARARVRAAWSFPGSPLTRVEILLDKKLVPVPHRFALLGMSQAGAVAIAYAARNHV